MNLLYKHIDRDDLLKKMSQLAREELLHFEQVVNIMKERNIAYRHVSSSRYAAGLREAVRKGGVDELTDVLIVGAFIEARSCERFAKTGAFSGRQAGEILPFTAAFRRPSLSGLPDAGGTVCRRPDH